jgi:prolyl oligopeptidase
LTDAIAPASHARIAHRPVEARPETVEFGGVRYQDPFRWLEEDSDASVTEWQTAEDQLTQAYLAALPGFRPFAERLAAFEPTDNLSAPTFAGGRWFITRVPDGEDLGVVEVADSPTGPGRRLIDLNAMRTDEPLALQGFVPSPDGRKAVFGWAAGGRELTNFQIIDVDSGDVLVERIPHERPLNIAWLPDSSGILYLAHDFAVSTTDGRLFRLTLENPTQPTVEPVEFGSLIATPKRAGDGRHVLLMVNHLQPRAAYILDTRGDGVWRPFLQGLAGMFRGEILGDNFIAITDDGAPRGRLVSIPLATSTQRETWKEIVPASDDVLMTVMTTGGRITLLDLVDTYARLRVFAADGGFEGEIELPGRGAVNTFASIYALPTMLDCLARADDGAIVFVYSSIGEAPALYRADVRSRRLTQLTRPLRRLDVQVLDLECRSADGARVTYQVAARRGIGLSVAQPTVITGYGGFNAGLVPAWLGDMWAAWVEAGGVVVLSHLRGGGEYGPQWWEQGRMELKQNTFNDVYAIAEDLIERGITTADHLGVIGGSNGGVMAAVVAVQRPDLFRASVPQALISDALARLRDPITVMATADYGDPTDPKMAKVLYAWSPYQNVQDKVDYPAVYLDCGANDPRCPPWHGRKLAARLQQATSSDRPILLRVRAGAGHGTVGRADHDYQSAEVLAFLAEQLGLAV